MSNYLKLTLYLYMEFLDCVRCGQFSRRCDKVRERKVWI